MAIPALLGGLARGALAGSRTAIAGSLKEGVRGAARGAVKRTLGGKKGKMKSPIGGESDAGPGGGGGGGAIVPRGGALVSSINTSSIVPSPKSEVVVAKKSGGGEGDAGIISSLDNIRSLLEQILSIEQEEQRNIKDRLLSASRERERELRDEEQEKQEEGAVKRARKKPENPIVKGAKKAVKGIWGLIGDFVKDFILYKILDWFGDPKNKKNVQRIVEFFQGAVKFFSALFDFTMGQIGSMMGIISNSLKIFGAFLQPLLDILTLKWLTNPGEFLKNILNIPKILFEAIPELFKSLLNFITFGLFDNLGNWIGDIISNFNPLKLLGFGGEDKEEGGGSPPKQEQQKPKEGGGGMLSMLNPMNWFGGGDKQTVDTESLPKLKEGGIVSPPAGAKGTDGVDGAKGTDAKSLTQGSVTVHPLEKIVDVTGISENLTKAMKPFMDMLVAPFKIIGTAIVGLILKTVSKIPFVGNIIEPIIRMAASTFGVPTNVLTQLKTQTREDREIKEVDKEKLLEKFSESITNVKESVEIAKKGGGNVFESFFSGAGKVMGGIGNLLGNLLTPPAAAATMPASTQRYSSGQSTSSAPPMQSFASHADAGLAGVSQYRNTETGKSYQKNEDGSGWSEMPDPEQGSGDVVAVNHPDTGSGYTVEGLKDAQGRPAVFSRGAAAAFGKMMKDSGGVVKGSDIASSQRSVAKNKAVGGVPNSNHLGGNALDIHGASQAWMRKNGAKYGWIVNDYPGSHGGHFNYKGGGATQTPPAQTQTAQTPQAQLTTKPSGSGQELQNTQQESLQLQSSSRTSTATPTFIDLGGGADKSSVQSMTSSSQSLGGTLPTNGLWSIFKTNL